MGGGGWGMGRQTHKQKQYGLAIYNCLLIFCFSQLQSLELYVFDDGESEESSYVLARVPLLPLAQGRTNITDTFTLTQVSIYRVYMYGRLKCYCNYVLYM